MNPSTIALALVSAFVLLFFIPSMLYFNRMVNRITRTYERIFQELIAENVSPMQLRKRPLGMPPYLEVTIGDVQGRVETRQQVHFVAKFPRPIPFRICVYPNSRLFSALGLTRLKLDPELDRHFRIYSDQPTLLRQRLAGDLRTTLIEGQAYLARLTLGRKKLAIGFRLNVKQLRKNLWLQLKSPEKAIDTEEMKSSIRWAISMTRELQMST